jgi:hypothetical protein
LAKRIYIAELDAHTARLETKIDNIQNRTIGASQRMEKAFKRVGAAMIAAFSAQQVLSFMKTSIDAFLESEKVARKLELQFGRTANSLQKYAKELQKVSVYEDDLIVQAMTAIGVFVKNEDVVKKLTKATMDLASAKGIDLLEAAEMVTKSFISNTNALKRQGFEIEGNAGSVERLDSLLKALSVTTGYAEAEAKTYTGQLQQMNNELNNQYEEIGQRLLPIYTALIKAFGFSTKTLVDAGKLLGQYFRTGMWMPLPEGETEKLEMMKTYTSGILRNEVDITKEKEKQVVLETKLIEGKANERGAAGFNFIQRKARGTGAPFWEGLGMGGEVNVPEKPDTNVFAESLEEAQSPMTALVSLSNQMASNFSFAGHTFVGQLSQAIGMVDSISNIILTIASLFGGGGGGFGIMGLLSLIGLSKGGRVTNRFGNLSLSPIPSFASGGSYSTPGMSGPFGGGYPVMVHRNETLDVYNSGQTSRMENKLDAIRNAILTTNVHVSKKGRSGDGVIKVNIGRREIATIVQEELNNFTKSGYNLGEF